MSTPPPVATVSSEAALWLNDTESQPLLQQNAVEDKQEHDNTPMDLGPTPRGLGPIQLSPDDIHETTSTPSARQSWRFNNLLEEVPAAHRSVLRDMGKGCLYIIATPIAFAAVGLYACGVIIEGVALVLKGVGSLGGSFLMRQRTGAPTAPIPEVWV